VTPAYLCSCPALATPPPEIRIRHNKISVAALGHDLNRRIFVARGNHEPVDR
jgi:hypothetical protein